MAIVTRKIGYKYLTKYNITFNFTYLQPTVTGPSYVWTLQQNAFTVAIDDYNIESITVTNASYTFNSTTGDLIIYDVVGNVVVTIAAVAKDDILYTLKVAGAQYADQGQYYGYWPSSGTITYTNKYGQSVTVNVANLNIGPGPLTISWQRTNAILKGTAVVCTNIALSSNYGSPSARNVRFYRYYQTSENIEHTGPGTGASYSYQNIDGSVIISTSGY